MPLTGQVGVPAPELPLVSPAAHVIAGSGNAANTNRANAFRKIPSAHHSQAETLLFILQRQKGGQIRRTRGRKCSTHSHHSGDLEEQAHILQRGTDPAKGFGAEVIVILDPDEGVRGHGRWLMA